MKRAFKFSRSYVIGVTFEHMIRSVNISIDKTVARLPELGNEDSKEVLETLSELHKLRESLEAYFAENPKQ